MLIGFIAGIDNYWHQMRFWLINKIINFIGKIIDNYSMRFISWMTIYDNNKFYIHIYIYITYEFVISDISIINKLLLLITQLTVSLNISCEMQVCE